MHEGFIHTSPMQSLGESFGSAIRKRRHQLGLSQEALADLAQIHRTYISAIELGKVSVGLDAANRIALALGVRLSDLIRAAEDNHPGAP